MLGSKRQTALIGGLAGRVMRAQEFIDGGGPGLLQERELGPTLEEVADKLGADILEPVQNLRKIAFQEGCQAITDPGAVTRQAPPLLD